jgi:hypothetical protein
MILVIFTISGEGLSMKGTIPGAARPRTIRLQWEGRQCGKQFNPDLHARTQYGISVDAGIVRFPDHGHADELLLFIKEKLTVQAGVLVDASLFCPSLPRVCRHRASALLSEGGLLFGVFCLVPFFALYSLVSRVK